MIKAIDPQDDSIVGMFVEEPTIKVCINQMYFFLLPSPPFSPCEGRQPILFLLLCSLVVLAWASICLGLVQTLLIQLNAFRQHSKI